MDRTQARYLNVALGIWLVISAFAWWHSPAHFTNTWLMGVITIVTALIAIGVPGFRFVNTAVGLWLMVSVGELPGVSSATSVNNAVVGVAITMLSFLGPRKELFKPRQLSY
jgi:hypothetical protein